MRSRIKTEPGVQTTPPRTNTNGRHSAGAAAAAAVVTPRTQIPSRPAAPPSASSTAMSPDDPRGHRSAAPTVDTRRGHYPVRVYESDSPDLVLMEVRPRAVKVERNVYDVPFAEQGGDLDKNLKDIGQHLKKFNDTLGTLQQLGIQHDEPLPELILVGDQSSGKSSIMSAISQIILPRSEGVCTRCPIHIRLSSDTTWRCRISLQQDYAYRPPNDEPITEADVTGQNPFPPWVKQQRVTQEFKMVYNKADPIDEIVRWAQIAILNHNKNYKTFVPRDWNQRTPEECAEDAAQLKAAEEQTEAKFSPNTVAIEVKGPELPDLSFYDMPGVFRNAKQERDQFLVKVVENLVRAYIAHEKAIILWAVPMNHDPETSSTFTLIRSLQAQHRTIGVMTKADLLPRGGYHQWLSMLAGEQHQVGRGYFITSRAPPAISEEQGCRDRQSLRDEQAAEEAFFNRQVHAADRTWPVEFSPFDDRCGIPQLVKNLAHTLAQEFARSLPDLSRTLHSKRASTRDALSKLPEMPLNPEYEVRKSLLKFTTDFQARIKSKAFSAEWGKIAETFKVRILDLKPRYRVMPDGFAMQRDISSGASDRESVFSVNNSPSMSIKRQRPIDLTADVTPSAQRRRGQNGVVKIEDANGSLFNNSPFTTPGGGGLGGNGRVQPRTLGQIRNLIRSEREAGKPGEVPYDVIEYLCMEAVRPWGSPLHTFLKDTMKFLQTELKKSLSESFKELERRQIYRKAKDLTSEWLKMHEARIASQLERNHKLETTRIYTMDDESFQRHRALEGHMLRRNRHFLRLKQLNNDTTYTKLPDWNSLTAEARRKEEQDMVKEAIKLGDDPYEVEMGVASHVRGYYLTAAMRFIDLVAMHITSGLFPDLEKDIDQYLDKKMGLDKSGLDAEFFAALMEEELSTAQKRDRLKAELERFEKAIEEIHDLNQTVTRASANGSNGHAPGLQDLDEDMLDEDEDEVEIGDV